MSLKIPHALLAVLLLASGLVSCNRSVQTTRSEIVTALQSSQDQLNLTAIGPAEWDQMCVLGPYTTNESAESILGFAWDAEGKTEIEQLDNIYVLVFTQNDEVAMHLEMPRHEGDLLNTQSPCFEFTETTIYRDAEGMWTTQTSRTPE